MPVDPYGPERIADRLTIQDLEYRWCRAVDRLDRQGMLDVFHPDATERHGAKAGSAADVVDWIMARHQDIPFVGHAMTNVLIEFAGPDIALVEACMRNIRRYPADSVELARLTAGRRRDPTRGMDVFTASRFLDRFERRADGWRIAERTLVEDWKRWEEVAPDEPPPAPDAVVGRRDRDDPVFVARRSLSLP